MKDINEKTVTGRSPLLLVEYEGDHHCEGHEDCEDYQGFLENVLYEFLALYGGEAPLLEAAGSFFLVRVVMVMGMLFH